ncbi:VOC family protein [Geodermatophilus sp. FMUSA9-8]|uniref:VOC family protein n=1 Tax=Geodermatophilus sp. FMUSA9-8 TaxID=3120155 RepID=UPI003008B34C
MIFVNLPVSDVAASRAFYTSLGFSVNEQFSDDSSVSVVVSDTIFLQLLSTGRFAAFLPEGRQAGDPRQTSAMHALSCDSREEVDALVQKALAAGGGTWRPAEDHGYMVGGSFTDPDGHVWEVMWMDPAQGR